MEARKRGLIAPTQPSNAPSANWLRYQAVAEGIGCPSDQVDNFRRAGVVLFKKQLAASAIARQCDTPTGPTEIGFGGARGGSKSFWLLAQIAVDDCQRFPGLKALILRKVLKSARESFEDLRQQVLKDVPNEYRRHEGVLAFPNGSRIILGHFKDERDIDSYLGLEYDVIGVEEATTLTKSKYDAIGTCNRTSRPGWRPRMYTTTNPGGVGHGWYRQRFVEPWRRGEETDTRFVQSLVYDNKAINPGYVQKLEGLTGWLRRAWLDGDWDIAAGQFFTTFRREIHVVKPFDIPANWDMWCALDYGFTHYTSCHLLAQSGEGVVYVVDEHGERRWLPKRHVEAITAMVERHGRKIGDLKQFVAGADVFARTRPEQTIAEEYASLGIKLRPANASRINGAGEFLSRLGDPDADIPPTMLIFDRCARLIETIPDLQHDPHRPEDVLKVDCDDDGMGGDDFFDSARYGLQAARKREIRFHRL